MNWRLQNLQMNCFLGREARPGAMPDDTVDEDEETPPPPPLPREIKRRSKGEEKTGENVS